MSKKDLINKFLLSSGIAVVGVSRNNKKFGYTVFREMKKKGFQVIPVNPNVAEMDGEVFYPSVDDIPVELNAILTVVPPEGTEKIIKELKRKDVRIIWMQSGSESEAAVELCREAGIEFITGECILMFAKPEGFHNIHRFFMKIFGKLPA